MAQIRINNLDDISSLGVTNIFIVDDGTETQKATVQQLINFLQSNLDIPVEIGDISGLQGALDGKANLVHTHTISQIGGLQQALDSKLGDMDVTLIGNTLNVQGNFVNIPTATSGADDARIPAGVTAGNFLVFSNTDGSIREIDFNEVKTTLAINNVANIAPQDYPVSTAQQTALDLKQDADTAFSGDYDDLSNRPTTITTNQATEITTNSAKRSYPQADETKLDGIESGADVTDTTNVYSSFGIDTTNGDVTLVKNQRGQWITNGSGQMNVQADWDETNLNADSYIENKPLTITDAERAKLLAIDEDADNTNKARVDSVIGVLPDGNENLFYNQRGQFTSPAIQNVHDNQGNLREVDGADAEGLLQTHIISYAPTVSITTDTNPYNQNSEEDLVINLSAMRNASTTFGAADDIINYILTENGVQILAGTGLPPATVERSVDNDVTYVLRAFTALGAFGTSTLNVNVVSAPSVTITTAFGTGNTSADLTAVVTDSDQTTGWTYSWTEGLDTTELGTEATYTATTNGTYHVVVTDDDGLTGTEQEAVVLNQPLSGSIAAEEAALIGTSTDLVLTLSDTDGLDTINTWSVAGDFVQDPVGQVSYIPPVPFTHTWASGWFASGYDDTYFSIAAGGASIGEGASWGTGDVSFEIAQGHGTNTNSFFSKGGGTTNSGGTAFDHFSYGDRAVFYVDDNNYGIYTLDSSGGTGSVQLTLVDSAGVTPSFGTQVTIGVVGTTYPIPVTDLTDVAVASGDETEFVATGSHTVQHNVGGATGSWVYTFSASDDDGDMLTTTDTVNIISDTTITIEFVDNTGAGATLNSAASFTQTGTPGQMFTGFHRTVTGATGHILGAVTCTEADDDGNNVTCTVVEVSSNEDRINVAGTFPNADATITLTINAATTAKLPRNATASPATSSGGTSITSITFTWDGGDNGTASTGGGGTPLADPAFSGDDGYARWNGASIDRVQRLDGSWRNFSGGAGTTAPTYSSGVSIDCQAFIDVALLPQTTYNVTFNVSIPESDTHLAGTATHTRTMT